MAGKLGQDFDPTEPGDSTQVRLGASWIRDIKNRLKAFCGVLFSLETGKLKPNVVPYTALTDLSPDPTGTWREVDVNSKGLVTAGRNPSELLQTPKFYRAVFTAGSGATIDTDTSYQTISDPGGSSYTGSGVYHQTYDPNSQYYTYNLEVPAGVRRMMAWVIGGGGGATSNGGASRNSGASGEFREGTMPVTPGTNLTIIVGAGGGGVFGTPPSSAANPGGTSMVSGGSSNYIEAAGGGGAAVGAAGVAQVGLNSSNIATLILPGVDGISASPYYVEGLAYYNDTNGDPYGTSGFAGADAPSTEASAGHGLVILEWVK